MKTLKELGLNNHKTANYADYYDRSDAGKNNKVCCGWMDIHTDEDNLGHENDPIFKVKPLFWYDDAIFVLKNKNKWISLSKDDFLARKKKVGIKYKGDAFYFDARKLHGLVPIRIFRLLAKDPISFEENDGYNKFVQEECGVLNSPKLVWEWV